MKMFFAIALVASLAAPSALGETSHHATRQTMHRSRSSTRSLYRPSSLDLKAPAVYRAKFATTQGDFVIEVHREWAPLGAERFYNLVKFGYYSGDSFFRMLPGFVVQFGLSPTARISQIWSKATVRDDPVAGSNTLGTVTFATAGPNTRTTQVFINLGDNSRLDRMGFAPFGKVVEGMDVVQKLYGGYGDGAPRGNGPDQDMIEKEGRAYLEKNFPKLDSIQAAVILRAVPPHPATARHPTAHHSTTPAKTAH